MTEEGISRPFREVGQVAPQSVAAKLRQAVAHHQRGELDHAERLYREILAQAPTHFDALHLLGVLQHQRGRHDVAVELIGQALKIDAGKAAAHLNIGAALRALKRPLDALASFDRALALNPDYADALNNRGNVLLDLKRPEEALASLDRALALKADYAEAHNNRGSTLLELKRPEEALASFERALAVRPDYAEAHNNRGNALLALKRPEEALASFTRSLALKPQYVDALNNRGIALRDLDRHHEALASFDAALALKRDDPEALNNRGSMLLHLNRHDEALASYEGALALQPNHADALSNRGHVLVHQGKLEEGAASFRKALSVNPELAGAHASLALAVKHAEHDEEIRAMERLVAREGLSSTERMHLCFALGKAYEELREYSRAFEHILEGNRILRASYDYSIAEDERHFENIKKIFSADFFSARRGSGCADGSAVFIVGMPRSGTTLVEQILASHRDVFGAGELPDLASLVESYCTQRGGVFPEAVSGFERSAYEGLGVDYVQRIRQRSTAAKRITDKRPHNFLMVGLIKAILPNAKVIHCMREPMDSCWSMFKLLATANFKFAHDMDDLGRYYSRYLDLMAHWRVVLPGFVHEVKYEEMVSDQEHQTRKLLEYCDLPWDAACLAFHRTKRTVATPSATQVRQPIYQGSVQLWKNYEQQLKPLRRALST
jgi:tetratricopeptide (TPR) repeat protein